MNTYNKHNDTRIPSYARRCLKRGDSRVEGTGEPSVYSTANTPHPQRRKRKLGCSETREQECGKWQGAGEDKA